MEENSFQLPYFNNAPLHNEKPDTKKFKLTLASRLVAW